MSDDHASRRCSGRTANGQRCRRKAEEGSTRCAQHGYRMPGRPSKLTPELTEAIVFLILEGNYLETAAQACGVDVATLYRWQRRAGEAIAKAEERVEDGEKLLGEGIYEHTDPADWPYLDFRHALKSAEAYAETELLRRAAAGGFGWQAPMTVLERRHPSHWRRRDRLEVEGADGGAVPLKLVAPETEAKRRAIAELITNAGVLAPAELEAVAAETKPTKPRRTKPK